MPRVTPAQRRNGRLAAEAAGRVEALAGAAVYLDTPDLTPADAAANIVAAALPAARTAHGDASPNATADDRRDLADVYAILAASVALDNAIGEGASGPDVERLQALRLAMETDQLPAAKAAADRFRTRNPQAARPGPGLDAGR